LAHNKDNLLFSFLEDGGKDTSSDGDGIDGERASSTSNGRGLSAGRGLVGGDNRRRVGTTRGLGGPGASGLAGDGADCGRDGDGLGDGGDSLGRAVRDVGRALSDGVSGGDADSRGSPLGGLGGRAAGAGGHLGGGRLLGGSLVSLLAGGLLGGGRLRGLLSRGGLGRLLSRGGLGRVLSRGRLGRVLRRGRLRGLLGSGGLHRGSGGRHGGSTGALAVGDAGAGRRDAVDVAAAVAKLGRDGSNVGGGAGEVLGAEHLSFFNEALVNKVVVAVVVLAAGEFVGHNAGGEGGKDNSSLHCDDG